MKKYLIGFGIAILFFVSVFSIIPDGTTGYWGLEIARGNVLGHSSINKFGYAIAGVQTTATDIWDRADSTPTQQIWIAPTQARVHAIKSSVVFDDADSTGSNGGAYTLRVFGLTDWDLREISNDITMDGTTNVNTDSSFVIIHRMEVLTKGDSASNVGVITATAATDGTITAQINAGIGQTRMAIYGISSLETVYTDLSYGDILKASGTVATISYSLLWNPEPDVQLTNFLNKTTRGVQSNGKSSSDWIHTVPIKFVGPGILKIQGISSFADSEGAAGFDGIKIKN